MTLLQLFNSSKKNFFLVFINFFLYIKISKDLSAKQYQDNKERLKRACERYKSLSAEQKDKKQQYGCERYKNLSKNEKQKLVG